MPQAHEQHHQSPYRSLALMTVLSFVAMYVLMYAMVDRFANVYTNVNQAYMAGLMAAPMIPIELLVMRAMYRSRRSNLLAIGLSAVLALVCFVGIRAQVGINDRQFLRSMIPHHAGAILMCEEASIRDPEVQALCEQIRASQETEIRQMKAMLEAMDR